MTIGERIKKNRTAKGISQIDLANKIGVSKQTLYKYENDIITNIPSDKIESIAEILEISPAELMGWRIDISINPPNNDNRDRFEKRMLAYYKMLNPLGQREAEKRIKELTQIQQYSLFVPQAAHNGHEADPDEQEKMQIDLTILKRPKEDNE